MKKENERLGRIERKLDTILHVLECNNFDWRGFNEEEDAERRESDARERERMEEFFKKKKLPSKADPEKDYRKITFDIKEFPKEETKSREFKTIKEIGIAVFSKLRLGGIEQYTTYLQRARGQGFKIYKKCKGEYFVSIEQAKIKGNPEQKQLANMRKAEMLGKHGEESKKTKVKVVMES